MPHYATVEDVKRVAGIAESDDSQDEAVTAALEAAESWVERRLRRSYSAGPTTETFFNVRSDGIIRLAEDNVTVTSVTDARGASLAYHVVDHDRIRVGGGNYWVGEWHPNLTSRTYYLEEVWVTYTTEGTVPAAVREAVALLAADLAPNRVDRDEETGEIIPIVASERIGDYQYKFLEDSLKAGVLGNKTSRAMKLLRPFLKRRVAVV